MHNTHLPSLYQNAIGDFLKPKLYCYSQVSRKARVDIARTTLTRELQIQLHASWYNVPQIPSIKYNCNTMVIVLQKPRTVFSESIPSVPTCHKTNFYSLSACRALVWLNKCFPLWWTWELKISYYSCLQFCPFPEQQWTRARENNNKNPARRAHMPVGLVEEELITNRHFLLAKGHN